MDPLTKITIPKVRTYAADLSFVRATQKSGAVKTKPPVVTTETPIKRPAEAKSKNGDTIPPFHTFTQAGTITQEPLVNSKVKVIGEGLTAADLAKESGPAIIITDTKHKRFKITEAISDSLHQWWNKKKDTVRKSKTPQYTVPEAELRKGVIQKATAKTGRSSSADHSAVLARIKVSKQIPHSTTLENSTPIIAATLEPAWESDTVTQAPQSAGLELQNSKTQVTLPPTIPQHTSLKKEVAREHNWDSDIQAKINSLGNTQAVAPSKIILTGKEFSKIKQQRLNNPASQTSATKITPIIPSPVTIPIRNNSQAESENFAADAIRPISPVRNPEPEDTISETVTSRTIEKPIAINRPKILPTIPAPLVATLNTGAKIEPETTAVIQANVFSSEYSDEEFVRDTKIATPQRQFAPPRSEKRSLLSKVTGTNQLVFIICGVFILVIASGLGLRNYLSSNSSNIDESVPIELAEFANTTVTNTPVYLDSKETLIDALKKADTTNDSLIEINFVDQATGGEVTAASLFTILDATVLFDFKAAITKVTIGNYRTAPWILLNITDKNTAYGGMLQWEKNMGNDLMLIYADSSGQLGAAFTDSVVDTTDVRILKNTDGKEQIVYGFVSSNQLLITRDTTTFLNLANNLQ